MDHTPECCEAWEKAKKAQSDYNAAWPDSCQNCQGHGAFYDPGSYWDPPSEEPCDDCWGQGKCPRCGKPDAFKTEDAEPPCQHCGWDPKNLETLPPYEYVCHGCLED